MGDPMGRPIEVCHEHRCVYAEMDGAKGGRPGGGGGGGGRVCTRQPDRGDPEEECDGNGDAAEHGAVHAAMVVGRGSFPGAS